MLVNDCKSILDYKSKDYLRNSIYTNAIEGFGLFLKRNIIAIYRLISKQHTQRFVDGFVFRYNTCSIQNTQGLICSCKIQDIV